MILAADRCKRTDGAAGCIFTQGQRQMRWQRGWMDVVAAGSLAANVCTRVASRNAAMVTGC